MLSHLVDGLLGKLREEVSNKMCVNEVNKVKAKNDEKINQKKREN